MVRALDGVLAEDATTQSSRWRSRVATTRQENGSVRDQLGQAYWTLGVDGLVVVLGRVPARFKAL